jgi:prophage antirepressor-like protein
VAVVLELGNPRSSLALLDEDEKGVHTMDTPGGPQEFATVNEPGLYSLILRSRKPQAKAFKRWVTHEVIPAIRKTGSYSVPLADPLAEIERQTVMTMRAITLAKRERVRADIAESLVRELVPSANAWDILATADCDFAAADAAKILSRDPAINLGERTLLGVLIALGWAYRQRGDRRPRAYQHAVKAGRLTELPQHSARRPGKRARSTPQVRVTVKGLLELHRRLGSGRQLALSVADLAGGVPLAAAGSVEVRALPKGGRDA